MVQNRYKVITLCGHTRFRAEKDAHNLNSNMILTTTPAIDGHTIREYKGVVFGEVITGVNFLKDFAASIRNFVGGRSESYESELVEARQKAMDEMAQRARSLGANAVVGIDIDYEVLGADNGMLMVTASGTAVIIDQ